MHTGLSGSIIWHCAIIWSRITILFTFTDTKPTRLREEYLHGSAMVRLEGKRGPASMTVVRLFIVGVVIALVLVIAAFIWIDRSTPLTVTVNTLAPRDMRVFVSGAVATLGVVTVPEGARLVDVVQAAGGFTDDTDYTSLNLAGRVGDGENVFVPSSAVASGSVSPVSSVRVPGSGTKLNLNTATIEELDTLPGIGDVLAGRIVEYREANGPFGTVDDLVLVDGISARMVEGLKPLVTIDAGG